MFKPSKKILFFMPEKLASRYRYGKKKFFAGFFNWKSHKGLKFRIKSLLTPKFSVGMVFLFIGVFGILLQPFSSIELPKPSLLSAKIESLLGVEDYLPYESQLILDREEDVFQFNEGYQVNTQRLGVHSGAKFTASFSVDAEEDGFKIYDPHNQVSFKIYPEYELLNGRKDGSRIVYPLKNFDGLKIVSLTGIGYKEDIVLNSLQQNDMDLKYRLELPDQLQARLEADGSVGIYGVDDNILLGEVATGTEQDAKLLENARKNQEKNTLIFRIPAPTIVESGTKDTQVGVYYTLEGDTLTTHVRGLNNARSFPIAIDPSIYVDTAIKLSRGNNETNIDFDVANELIQKGATTGGRFPDWQNTLASDNNYWDAGTAVANGFLYSIGGALSDDSMYMTPGESQFVVPTGVSSITVKAWGAGGGGGGASENGDGGAGGGGGYATATLSVTAGEVLTIRVGEGGEGGSYTAPDDVIVGGGGGGGGYSGIFRTTTPLVIAGGGGGGGGDNGSGNGNDGGAGGAGGGTNGVAGSGDGATTGGGAGTASAGGTAGSTTTTGGTDGSSLQGGTGASNKNAFGDTAYGGGGAGGKGDTGTLAADRDAGGGGGGGGYYGGGGGGASNGDDLGGGGGGGGSGYVTGTGTSNTAGSGTTPGNSGDGDRNGAGDGGAGGVETGGEPTDGSDGDDGLVLVTVASNQVDATDDVWWAEVDPSSQDLSSPNPGAGACTQWCNDADYDLPAARKGAAVVAYNGFIYVIGGENASGTRQTTVYIGKLGANGEPSLWHPTDTNKDNWVYWYSDTALSTEKSYASVVAYNNRLYLLGGQTNASSGGVTEVLYTDIEPTGTLESWTSTGMTSLPSARHNHSALVYNDHMYLIGGNSSGTIQTAVHYINLASNGTMDGSWIATTSMDTARMAWGGKFAAIFGGFIYIAGGCSAVNGSGYCTGVQNDVRLNSINADGSLTKWTSILDVTNERIGHGLEAWGEALYTIGGCRSQNATTGDCDWGVTQNVYGSINSDGDASTVRNSELSGAGNCTGVSPTDCHLPPEGDNNGSGGNMSGGAVINNGVIYYFGGCTAVGNGSICYTGASPKATDNLYYAAIGDDGQLQRVDASACTGSGIQFYGNWCVDNSNVLPGKRAGMGVALFDNTVYLIGGTDGTTFQSDVYYMTFNSDGSIGTWNTQTFANLDLGSARGYMYAFTRANPSSAGTYPGNLYVIGGCAPSPITNDGVDCGGTFSTEVYKCNITTTGALEEGDSNDCTTTGQTQLDSEPGTGGSQGLGTMSGTVYANYVYLIGGQSDNESARGSVMYAKIDDSNNIVDADGETATDDIWETSGNEIDPVRRRGSAFGYNGYLYALAGYNAGETLNDLLYAKIDVSDGSIGAFVESDVTVLPRWDLQAIVSNGFVYTLGGCATGVPPQDCTTMQRTVQTFQLYNNYSGSPAGYSAGANLFDGDRIGHSAAILNGYLYVAGGTKENWDPNDLDPIVWVDGQDVDGDGDTGDNPSNGATVTDWIDKSPYGNDLDSTAQTGDPTYDATAQTLEFADNTEKIGNQALSGFTEGNNAKTSVVVHRLSGTADTLCGVSRIGGGLSTANSLHWQENGTIRYNGGNDDYDVDVGSTLETVVMATSAGNSTNLEVWKDGSSLGNGTYTGSTWNFTDNLNLNASWGATPTAESGTPCDSSIAEVLVFDYELGTADRQNLENYLMNKWGTGGAAVTDEVTDDVQYAAIDASGAIGAWSHASDDLPAARTNGQLEAAGGTLYYIGGTDVDGDERSEVYYSTPSAGDTTSWATASNGLPADRTDFSAAVWNDRIYVTGGLDDAGAETNTVYYSMDLSSGGNITSAWTSDADTFDVARSGMTTVAYANNLYIFGGHDGTNYLNDSQFTQINTDGSIDAWQFSTSLPEPIREADGFAVNGYLYLIGGRTDDTTCTPNTWVTPISANTTIATGNNPTGVGAWYETQETYTGDRYGSGVVYYDGQAFVTGGGCGATTTYTGANRIVQTTVQSQPQVARYSYYIDADTDIFPTKWLANGLDNDIGARWTMDYRSSTDANNEWGQTTNFGDITLGNPEDYTPLDASGTDTNFARYYYLQLDIDSSQAYGYPDDVTRGPTIDDLTLFFTSDPGKRLRHGKTFTGGLQQPLDTPPPP